MKKLTVKQIRDAYHALYMAFDSSKINYAEKLLAMCITEEKGHRGFMDGFTRSHTRDTISTRDAAKLFAVKRVAFYMACKPDETPQVKDYLHTQKSCFMAAAIALEYPEKVNEAWKDFTLAMWKDVAALDYSDYVKVKPAHEMPATV